MTTKKHTFADWTQAQLIRSYGITEEQANTVIALENDEQVASFDLHRISQMNCFAAKIAATVITSGRISDKQADILNQVSMFEFNSNHGYDAHSFDAFLTEQRNRQAKSAGLI
jgi:hypothetical protein